MFRPRLLLMHQHRMPENFLLDDPTKLNELIAFANSVDLTDTLRFVEKNFFGNVCEALLLLPLDVYAFAHSTCRAKTQLRPMHWITAVYIMMRGRGECRQCSV